MDGRWKIDLKKRKCLSIISNEKKKQKVNNCNNEDSDDKEDNNFNEFNINKIGKLQKITNNINTDKYLKRKTSPPAYYADIDFDVIGNYTSDEIRKKYNKNFKLSKNNNTNNNDNDSDDSDSNSNNDDIDDDYVEYDNNDNNDDINDNINDDGNNDDIKNVDNSNNYNNNVVKMKQITKSIQLKAQEQLKFGDLCYCCKKSFPNYSISILHKIYECNTCKNNFCGGCIVDDKPESDKPNYTCLSINCYILKDIPLKRCCLSISKFWNINNSETIGTEIIEKICDSASILSIYSLSLVCKRFRFLVKKYLDKNLENRFKSWIAKWLRNKLDQPKIEINSEWFDDICSKWHDDILYPLKKSLPVSLSGSSILYFLMDMDSGFNDFDYYYMNIKNIEYKNVAPSNWINNLVTETSKHYLHTRVTKTSCGHNNNPKNIIMDFIAINYPYTSIEKYISDFHFSILRNYLKYNNNGKMELFIGNIEDIIKGVAHVNIKLRPDCSSTLTLSKNKLKRINTLRLAHINKYFNKKFKFESFNNTLEKNFKFVPIN